MIELLSDQENEVDRREEAFGKRAVGKCRDYQNNRQMRTPGGKKRKKKKGKLTGSSVSVSVSPAHAIPGVVQIAFPSFSQSLSSPGVAPAFSLCLGA